MNRLVSSVLFVALSVGPLAGAARAVSIEDLINLKANGLGDGLLIELIEVDGSSFQLTADDVIALHKRGLSDAVLHAMVRTGRQPVVAEAAAFPAVPAAEPQAASGSVVISVPVNVEVPVYVPVIVPVVAHRQGPPVKAPEPVCWGFGGKLRPDAWKPAPEPAPPSRRDEPVRSSSRSR